MKYVILLLFTVNVFSQIQLGQTQDLQINISVDPVATYNEKSPNLDVNLELVNYGHYVKAGVQILPALLGGYVDVTMTNGFNITVGRFKPLRSYLGARTGLIFRTNNTYPLIGFEGGLSLPVNNTIIIGLRSTYDNRKDMKAFHWPVIWRASGFLVLSIKLG